MTILFERFLTTGDAVQAEALIKSGVNVNEKENENGLAPLHYSAGAGKLLILF